MTDPNAGATPESVADQIAGTDANGNPLPYEKSASFYGARMFGLPIDYAFPQGSYVSTALTDHATGLNKLLTRLTLPLADKNVYDAWDMLYTITKWILAQDVHINDDEIHSVNYKPPTPTPVAIAEKLALPGPRGVDRLLFADPHDGLRQQNMQK